MPKPTHQMTEREEILQLIRNLRLKGSIIDLQYLADMAAKHPEVSAAIRIFGTSDQEYNTKLSTRELDKSEKEFLDNLNSNGLIILGTLEDKNCYEFQLLSKHGAITGRTKRPITIQVPTTATNKPKSSSKEIVRLLMESVAKIGGTVALTYQSRDPSREPIVDKIQLLSKDQVKALKPKPEILPHHLKLGLS